MLGIGHAKGEDRARCAAERALTSPLLDRGGISGAASVLISITGGTDVTIDEVTTVSSMIQEAAGDEAEIVFGAAHDSEWDDAVRVILVATGLETEPSEGLFNIDHFVPKGVADVFPGMSSDSGTPAQEMIEPVIAIAWDPDVVDPETYAEIVEILGDLSRLEGGRGITRIRSEGFGMPAMDEVLA